MLASCQDGSALCAWIMMLGVVEHASAIAPSLQITNAVAADRLTTTSASRAHMSASAITSASIVGMSAAWKIGDAGTRCMFIEMQGFS